MQIILLIHLIIDLQLRMMMKIIGLDSNKNMHYGILIKMDQLVFLIKDTILDLKDLIIVQLVQIMLLVV